MLFTERCMRRELTERRRLLPFNFLDLFVLTDHQNAGLSGAVNRSYIFADCEREWLASCLSLSDRFSKCENENVHQGKNDLLFLIFITHPLTHTDRLSFELFLFLLNSLLHRHPECFRGSFSARCFHDTIIAVHTIPLSLTLFRRYSDVYVICLLYKRCSITLSFTRYVFARVDPLFLRQSSHHTLEKNTTLSRSLTRLISQDAQMVGTFTLSSFWSSPPALSSGSLYRRWTRIVSFAAATGTFDQGSMTTMKIDIQFFRIRNRWFDVERSSFISFFSSTTTMMTMIKVLMNELNRSLSLLLCFAFKRFSPIRCLSDE